MKKRKPSVPERIASAAVSYTHLDVYKRQTWVNAHFVLAPDVPFGGSKQSGMGFEFSRDGLLQFTDTRVVHVEKG